MQLQRKFPRQSRRLRLLEDCTLATFHELSLTMSSAKSFKSTVMYDKYSGRSRRFAFVTMKTVEDASAAVEKLNGTEVGGRAIKVNITEKPLASLDASLLQVEESQYIDSPHKVYVGNLAKTVTTETLKTFFSEKGKVLDAKVS